jgi:hypothetical protein
VTLSPPSSDIPEANFHIDYTATSGGSQNSELATYVLKVTHLAKVVTLEKEAIRKFEDKELKGQMDHQ